MIKTGKSILGALAVAAALVGSPTSAQAPIADARVSLRVEGRALSEVVDHLRERSGFNIVVVEGGDTPISIDLTDVNWFEALELAAELAGCVVEERTAGVLVVDRPPRVDFAFDNAELRQVIDTIIKLSGANIVVAPEVAGTLSLRLTNVPWRDALDVAVKTLGYVVVEEDRNILRVVDPLSLQAQMETHSYQLRYVRPPGNYVPIIESEFLVRTTSPRQQGGGGAGQIDWSILFPVIGALKKALSPGGDLDYILEQNVIIVRDTAQVHASIREMLDRLDVEPAQVFVDVKFVSTSTSDVFSLGVDYGDLGPQVSISGGQIPVEVPFTVGSSGWEDSIIASPSGDGPFANADGSGNGGATVIPDTIFGALSFTQVQATLKMLQRDASTEVVQAPKLIALDGREATIFVGETIRYAEAKSEQGQAGGLQLSVAEASSSPVEVGFQLLIVPHVIPGTNKLTMDVIPKETSLSGSGDGITAPPGFDVFTVGASGLEGTIALPRKRSSTIVTSMMLESGQTAVIGGLTTEQEVQRTTQIPWLGSIPVLGWLFKAEDETIDKRSLMVFITPAVVRSTAETQRLLRRELEARRGEYRERLEDILYGGMPPEEVPAPPAGGGGSASGEPDLEWGTFVEDPSEAEAGE